MEDINIFHLRQGMVCILGVEGKARTVQEAGWGLLKSMQPGLGW